MPSKDNKILEFSQYQGLECIIENSDRSKNNPENSSTTNSSTA